ncbi:hypothetical protein EW146_g1871 [Bondarzewia mesenterica]|uniref:HNH nuclease domain-containing protein n=1 Tax=Bondarzewia mesenterica TaxID=1095465 RepID=A0A4S4M4B9_9AGAM|nr:hypothetical protein EW146_g1871 [Bondarzewia mesenterica]
MDTIMRKITGKTSQSSMTGSSKVSDTIQQFVKARDYDVCILCGQGGGDVCHVIARTEKADHELAWLRRNQLVPSDYMKNDPSNLLFLCHHHHQLFNNNLIALVPSLEDLEVLIAHEHKDYISRELAVQQRLLVPPRTLPSQLSRRFDYIFFADTAVHKLFIGPWEQENTNILTASWPPMVLFSYRPPRFQTIQIPVEAIPMPTIGRDCVRFIIGLNVDNNRLSPFPLLIHAMRVLHGAHMPADLFFDDVTPMIQPAHFPLELIEKQLVTLRALYNRFPPVLETIPSLSSSDTIRQIPPVFGRQSYAWPQQYGNPLHSASSSSQPYRYMLASSVEFKESV